MFTHCEALYICVASKCVPKGTRLCQGHPKYLPKCLVEFNNLTQGFICYTLPVHWQRLIAGNLTQKIVPQFLVLPYDALTEAPPSPPPPPPPGINYHTHNQGFSCVSSSQTKIQSSLTHLSDLTIITDFSLSIPKWGMLNTTSVTSTMACIDSWICF